MDKAELIKLSEKELKTILSEKQENLRQMRFKSGQRQLKDIREIRSTRRNIANILTILNK